MPKSAFTQKKRKRALTPRQFRVIIDNFYKTHGRRFPWRRTRNPYHIFISEMMLQQTQVERVREKYPQFIRTFPDVAALAGSSLGKVLETWQGLGYNRRALFLHRTAQRLMEQHRGKFPQDYEALLELPGIGQSTAGAICAFAYNIPHVFIETNIRRVFLHFFFPGKKNVRDTEIIGLIEKTLDKKNPRRWYWALMDYGTYLKKTSANPNRRSAHYGRQSPFKGSNRQVRGAILKVLTQEPAGLEKKLIAQLPFDSEKIIENLKILAKEGFLKKKRGRLSIR